MKRIGGRTWISENWNAGVLNTAIVLHAAIEWRSRMDEDILRSVAYDGVEIARELYGPESNGLIDQCVELETVYALMEHAARCAVANALWDLYEHWTDDVEDSGQYRRVLQAHTALLSYCQSLADGAFWFDDESEVAS